MAYATGGVEDAALTNCNSFSMTTNSQALFLGLGKLDWVAQHEDGTCLLSVFAKKCSFFFPPPE